MNQPSFFSVTGPSNGVNPGVSYLSSSTVIRSQKKALVKIQKCGCGSVWCKRCSKRKVARLIERIKTMDWQRVRHIVLTVDREKFESGLDAWLNIMRKKAIANLIWNLRRTAKVNVIDWIWVMEFHRDGYPHWHILVEVKDQGKWGMIGQKLLHKYWVFGAYIREEFIRSKKHWSVMTGYFKENGYFGDKGSQSTLPEWAMDLEKKIRRWGSMVIEGCSDGKTEELDKKIIDGFVKEIRTARTNRMILEGCGKDTLVMIEVNDDALGWGAIRKVKLPIQDMKDGFNYEQGLGWVKEFTMNELRIFLGSKLELLLLRDRLDEYLRAQDSDVFIIYNERG